MFVDVLYAYIRQLPYVPMLKKEESKEEMESVLELDRDATAITTTMSNSTCSTLKYNKQGIKISKLRCLFNCGTFVNYSSLTRYTINFHIYNGSTFNKPFPCPKCY